MDVATDRARKEMTLYSVKWANQNEEGGKVQSGKGDFVTFPEGLSCVWDIKEPVRKHYNFS